MGRGAAAGATGAGVADDDDDEVRAVHMTSLSISLHLFLPHFYPLSLYFLTSQSSLSLTITPPSLFLRQDETKKEDSWILKLPDPNRSRDYRNGGTLRDYQIEGNLHELLYPVHLLFSTLYLSFFSSANCQLCAKPASGWPSITLGSRPSLPLLHLILPLSALSLSPPFYLYLLPSFLFPLPPFHSLSP
jgi:hypothetical protein